VRRPQDLGSKTCGFRAHGTRSVPATLQLFQKFRSLRATIFSACVCEAEGSLADCPAVRRVPIRSRRPLLSHLMTTHPGAQSLLFLIVLIVSFGFPPLPSSGATFVAADPLKGRSP
jgi:hypothetical protein